MDINKVYQGDSFEVLRTFPAESIDMCITSPPYWSLRDYGSDTNKIWNGDPKCQHEMTYENVDVDGVDDGAFGKSTVNFSKDYFKIHNKRGFCKKCGAWYGQLGLEPDPDLFVKHLCDIFDGVRRALKESGSCWVNIGDTYGGDMNFTEEWADSGQIPSQWRPKETLERGTKVPQKCLAMIPFRFALEMVRRGWILRNTVIWYKPACLPSSVRDRFTVDFEYVFFFSKNKKYYFEQQFDPYKDSYIDRIKSFIRNEEAYDPEKHKTDPSGMAQSSMQLLENAVKSNGLVKNPGRNKRCVWSIHTASFEGAHFATFPMQLLETPIKATCPEEVCSKCKKPREKIYDYDYKGATEHGGKYEGAGVDGGLRNTTPFARTFKGHSDCGCNAPFEKGIVLDPFMGSGTTAIAALMLLRSFVGIEINPEYIKMAEERIKPYLEQTKLGDFSDNKKKTITLNDFETNDDGVNI